VITLLVTEKFDVEDALSPAFSTRIFYILRFLSSLNDYKKGVFTSVHNITNNVSKEMHTTLRDEDVKKCILNLVEKGLVEEMQSTDSKAYKISEKGKDFWIKNRTDLSILFFR
jgi:predicted transcriptional regulator